MEYFYLKQEYCIRVVFGDEDKMHRASIIVENKNFYNNISMFFGKPVQVGRTIIEINEDKYDIIILEIPDSDNTESRKKNRNLVENYCKKRNINTILYKKTKSDYINCKIIAIKALCLLREIERKKGMNLFNRRFGIIFNDLKTILIEALAYEASSIIIFDQDFSGKEKLFEKVIRDKGLSIVYTKDIEIIIEKSDIIVCENTMHIRNYEHLLTNKILINNLSEAKLIRNQIAKQDIDPIESIYNDEIIEIFLMLNESCDVWNIAKFFNIML